MTQVVLTVFLYLFKLISSFVLFYLFIYLFFVAKCHTLIIISEQLKHVTETNADRFPTN